MLVRAWLVGAWFALAISGEPSALPASAVELESLENTIDGSVLRACRLHGQVRGSKRYEAWLAFGEIKQGKVPPLEVSSSALHCQEGSSRKAGSLFGRLLGTPYLIVDIEVVSRGGKVQASVSKRKFSGWDGRGGPTYAQLERRAAEIDGASEAVVPILVADSFEKEAFRIEEIFLRLREKPLGRREAAYGAISVTADTPGAWVLLDGGPVARVLETGPTLVENVLTGSREVILRDLSGREARRSVQVEKDGRTEVTLALREPPSGSEEGFVSVGRNPHGHEEHWRTADGALVVTIPAGEAWIGSDEKEGEAHERPRRRVFVSAFRIDKTEVTWRQLRRFARATGTPLPPAPVSGAPDDFPASNVTWEEARAFCSWVGGRLPTEAEWEKANRGTEGARFPWGNDWHPGRCNSWDGGPHRPESVGSFPECTSPYGVLDMPGSVWEWCSDWFSDSHDPTMSARDPEGPDSGSMRVVRGGCWVNQPSWLRAAYRYRAEPSGRHPHHGFRCAGESGR